MLACHLIYLLFQKIITAGMAIKGDNFSIQFWKSQIRDRYMLVGRSPIADLAYSGLVDSKFLESITNIAFAKAGWCHDEIETILLSMNGEHSQSLFFRHFDSFSCLQNVDVQENVTNIKTAERIEGFSVEQNRPA
jgi:hypothetical protein